MQVGIPLSLLVIEDSEDDTLLLVEQLNEGGFDTSYKRVDTHDAMEAALRERDWDLIIADHSMPRFSSAAALEELEESGLDIPFLLVSGTVDIHTATELMRAGARDFILKHESARLVPAVKRELRDAEIRRERIRAERALQESEERQRDFYKRTILAATEGKLVICESEELQKLAGPDLQRWEILEPKDLGPVRDAVAKVARSLGMEALVVDDFIHCVGEATTNAVKHASGGVASLHRVGDSLVFTVADHGAGIEALALPELALKRGYTTSISLGMGYKIMISVADKVYLATGPAGTIVGVEMNLHPDDVSAKVDELPETWTV